MSLNSAFLFSIAVWKVRFSIPSSSVSPSVASKLLESWWVSQRHTMDQREGKGALQFLCPSTHILDFVVAGAILEEFLRFVSPRTHP